MNESSASCLFLLPCFLCLHNPSFFKIAQYSQKRAKTGCLTHRLLFWRSSGWDSALQCRGHSVDPWSWRIPHASGHLSPWATTAEPRYCNDWSLYTSWNLELQLESNLHLLQLKNVCVQQHRPSTAMSTSNLEITLQWTSYIKYSDILKPSLLDIFPKRGYWVKGRY